MQLHGLLLHPLGYISFPQRTGGFYGRLWRLAGWIFNKCLLMNEGMSNISIACFLMYPLSSGFYLTIHYLLVNDKSLAGDFRFFFAIQQYHQRSGILWFFCFVICNKLTVSSLMVSRGIVVALSIFLKQETGLGEGRPFSSPISLVMEENCSQKSPKAILTYIPLTRMSVSPVTGQGERDS